MTLSEYFQLPSSPMEFSPVGKMMTRIFEESPEIPFEQARELAQIQLNLAAGRKKYVVFTPLQEKRRRERLKDVHFKS